MKKILFPCFFALASAVFAEDTNGALANLRAVPAELQSGILKLSADDCDPNPDIWYVVTKADSKKSGFRELEMASGQVVSNKPTLGLRESFSSDQPLQLAKIQFDSRDAFDLAQRYARANNKVIASVSFALTQKGSSAVPVWYVWCYGPNETYFGQIQFLATDGTVISNDAFPKNP